MKFRNKPVVIDAIQWTGDNIEEIGEFLVDVRWAPVGHNVVISTREGDMVASPNDWIIKGVAGEFYPCKPDIFAATYEPEDARQAFPGHTDNIAKITQVINERLHPDRINVEAAAGTPNTYNIEVFSKATGPHWSFWTRVRDGVILEYAGEGGSWDAARDRTEWLMSAVTALRQKGIQNFYMRIAEL